LRSRGGGKTAFLGKENRIHNTKYGNQKGISKVMHFLREMEKNINKLMNVNTLYKTRHPTNPLMSGNDPIFVGRRCDSDDSQ
jgi:hypothetical protein